MSMRFIILILLLAWLSAGSRLQAQPSAEECLQPPTEDARLLLPELARWIDAQTGYDASAVIDDPPWIEFCSTGEAIAYEGDHVLVEDGLRAAYDMAARRIYLVEPWSAGNLFDRSVLLHELVHDIQLRNRDWPCIGAPEWEAYKLQDAWLKEQGHVHEFDWLFIYMTSRCPRDIHP